MTLLHPDGRFEVGALTSSLALRLDNAQYAVGEKPYLDTVRDGHLLQVVHLRFEHRWPSYVAQAVAVNVQSHLSVELILDGESQDKHSASS